jgi:hypothetical protein
MNESETEGTAGGPGKFTGMCRGQEPKLAQWAGCHRLPGINALLRSIILLFCLVYVSQIAYGVSYTINGELEHSVYEQDGKAGQLKHLQFVVSVNNLDWSIRVWPKFNSHADYFEGAGDGRDVYYFLKLNNQFDSRPGIQRTIEKLDALLANPEISADNKEKLREERDKFQVMRQNAVSPRANRGWNGAIATVKTGWYPAGVHGSYIEPIWIAYASGPYLLNLTNSVLPMFGSPGNLSQQMPQVPVDWEPLDQRFGLPKILLFHGKDSGGKNSPVVNFATTTTTVFDEEIFPETFEIKLFDRSIGGNNSGKLRERMVGKTVSIERGSAARLPDVTAMTAVEDWRLFAYSDESGHLFQSISDSIPGLAGRFSERSDARVTS